MDAATNEKCELCCDMRAVVKFYRLKGKISTKTFEKMKSIYSDDCLSWMQVFTLDKEFLEGWETAGLHNSQHKGQPSTLFIEINVNTVRTLVEEDRSLT